MQQGFGHGTRDRLSESLHQQLARRGRGLRHGCRVKVLRLMQNGNNICMSSRPGAEQYEHITGCGICRDLRHTVQCADQLLYAQRAFR